MRNAYCMFKGKLLCGAPYSDTYIGSPHYVITVGKDDGATFNIVVNSASTPPAANGDNRVYAYIGPNFVDPICDKLKALPAGLYTGGFPKLDYWQDRSLLDIGRMRPLIGTRPAPASTSTMRSTISLRSMKMGLPNSVPITMAGIPEVDPRSGTA
jgi:uncharacterized protein YukJ